MSRYRNVISRGLERYRAAKSNRTTEKGSLQDLKTTKDDLEQASAIAQTVAEGIQREAHERIAGLVTRCLRTVFGDDAYTFELQVERKRGQVEVRPLLLRDGEAFNPLDAAGGGVADVAAFGLRLAVLILKHPSPRRILILDESFRFLSVEYRPQVRALMEALSKELDFQFIFVTHSSDLEVGNVVRISK